MTAQSSALRKIGLQSHGDMADKGSRNNVPQGICDDALAAPLVCNRTASRADHAHTERRVRTADILSAGMLLALLGS